MFPLSEKENSNSFFNDQFVCCFEISFYVGRCIIYTTCHYYLQIKRTYTIISHKRVQINKLLFTHYSFSRNTQLYVYYHIFIEYFPWFLPSLICTNTYLQIFIHVRLHSVFCEKSFSKFQLRYAVLFIITFVLKKIAPDPDILRQIIFHCTSDYCGNKENAII